ncbi:hypothetical protein [Pseudomonas sp. T1.Ur]|uniref:hypothetical protein n=1 Tax=Pseudomonas sp. T1.Ur TaxID=2928704 RepID=UPI00201E622A|nr:hypothetical protein [Pseudomonas sp. T1.Ur]MCL6702737.1 hypothetical protein [Pseudomonas sp. T1.Ur]
MKDQKIAGFASSYRARRHQNNPICPPIKVEKSSPTNGRIASATGCVGAAECNEAAILSQAIESEVKDQKIAGFASSYRARRHQNNPICPPIKVEKSSPTNGRIASATGCVGAAECNEAAILSQAIESEVKDQKIAGFASSYRARRHQNNPICPPIKVEKSSPTNGRIASATGCVGAAECNEAAILSQAIESEVKDQKIAGFASSYRARRHQNNPICPPIKVEKSSPTNGRIASATGCVGAAECNEAAILSQAIESEVKDQKIAGFASSYRARRHQNNPICPPIKVEKSSPTNGRIASATGCSCLVT